jgi:hypothetical protein
MIGAGAVVTKDVPPYAIVVGNPARITGYVPNRRASSTSATNRTLGTVIGESTEVAGVRLYELPLLVDLRGGLSFAEYDTSLPFPPRRYFLIFDVPSKDVRGEHAHRKCQQLLVCAKGSCSVVVDDGENRTEILLDRPNLALYLPPMIWATQFKYSKEAVLLVLASETYDADDYIRDYDLFLKEVKGRKA